VSTPTIPTSPARAIGRSGGLSNTASAGTAHHDHEPQARGQPRAGAHQLDHLGLVDQIGGRDAILALQTDTPGTLGVSSYVGLMRDTAARRQLIVVGTDMTAAAYNGRDADLVLADIRARLDAITSANGGAPARSSPLDCHQVFARTVDDIDWIVPDLWPARRAISIVATYKAGKSLLMFYVAACLSRGLDPWTHRPQPPITVGYFDHEMTEDDVHERALDFGFAPDELASFKYYLSPTCHRSTRPPVARPRSTSCPVTVCKRSCSTRSAASSKVRRTTPTPSPLTTATPPRRCAAPVSLRRGSITWAAATRAAPAAVHPKALTSTSCGCSPAATATR
jgi:hypothetical protein